MEGIELARELELTDAGRLLIMFECIRQGNEDIGVREVDAVAFLLSEKKILPFGYSFLLNPLPFSTRLREDLYSLIQTGYLDRRNPVYITRKGSQWVASILQHHGYDFDALANLIHIIKELLLEYRRRAFELVYAAMTL